MRSISSSHEVQSGASCLAMRLLDRNVLEDVYAAIVYLDQRLSPSARELARGFSASSKQAYLQRSTLDIKKIHAYRRSMLCSAKDWPIGCRRYQACHPHVRLTIERNRAPGVLEILLCSIGGTFRCFPRTLSCKGGTCRDFGQL